MATVSDPSSSAGNKTLGDRLQCVVVSPERTILDEVVDTVVLPLLDGELGVLPGRSPLLGRLGYGVLRTGTGPDAPRYFIDGGFAQVRDNVVTVLTNRALPVAQLDIATADAEFAQAEAIRTATADETAERTRRLDRARAMRRVAAQKG